MLSSFKRLAQDLGLKDFVLDVLLPDQQSEGDLFLLLVRIKAEIEFGEGRYLGACEVFGYAPLNNQLICGVYIAHDPSLRTTSLLFRPRNFEVVITLLHSFLTHWATASPGIIVRFGPLVFSQQAYVFAPYPSPVVGGPQAPTGAGLISSNILCYLADQPLDDYLRLAIEWPLELGGFDAAHYTAFYVISPDYPDDHFYNLELQR